MTFYNKIQLVLIFSFFVNFVFAQQTPAPSQTQPIIITGAVAHLGNGQVIENSAVAFEDGKITLVADARLIRIDGSKNYKTIDATGKHIYPGFINLVSLTGLSEINAVRATRDYREVGSLNPHVRSIIAYNTDSHVTPTIRSNGILMSQIIPAGSRIAGQSSVVQHDAWNWEDAAYKLDNGIHLRWPRMYQNSGWWAEPGGTKKNENYDKLVTRLTD